MRRFLSVVVCTAVCAAAGVSRLPAAPVTLVDLGSTWHFLDDGSDQGTLWRGEAFDHVGLGWDSGPAPLGYGTLGTAGNETPIATTVDYGGTAGTKFVTTYFRQSFEVDAAELAGFTQYTLSLMRDDAAVVYLNGQEVFRDAGLIADAGFDDLSSITASGAAENAFSDQTFLAGSLLHEGTNVIAVELHQATRGSSDLGIDLSLVALDDPIGFGDVSPNIVTGFEEAAAGATSFSRDAGHTELAWTMTGGPGSFAAVDDAFTDPGDPTNLHQFHVNAADIEITSEQIDVRDYVDVQVAADVRAWFDSGDFEDADHIKLSILASNDGFNFTELVWLDASGAEANALDLGTEAFSTFISPVGLVPDDTASIRVMLSTVINSANEHAAFDNVRVAGIVLSELAWDGSDAAWGEITGPPDASHWLGGDPDTVADGSTAAAIDGGAVTVAVDAEAYRLTVSGGSLSIDAAQSLAVKHEATFDMGTTLTLGSDATLDATGTLIVGGEATLGVGATLGAGGGSIEQLTIASDAVIATSAELVINDLAATAGGTLTKLGGGTLVLDNSQPVVGVVAADDTTFRVEEGMLKSKGTDPLGGSRAVILAGGRLLLEHDAALQLDDTAVAVIDDSRLEVLCDDAVSFGHLTISQGELTTSGTAESLRFAAAAIDPAQDVTEVELRTLIDTRLGVLDADSAGVTITKSGAADLILEGENRGVQHTTFAVRQGRLIALLGADTFDVADVSLSGGEVVLSAMVGAVSPVTYHNHFRVDEDSDLTAGSAGGGTADPTTVILGGGTRGLALSNGTLSLRATDGYRLQLAGPVSGPGALEFVEGDVEVDQPLAVGTLILSGGNLVRTGAGTPAGDVAVQSRLTLNGGSLDMSGSTLHTTPATDVSVAAGDTLTVENQNLVLHSLDLTGTLVRKGPPGDLLVGGNLTLTSTLDMTGAVLLTDPAATDVTVGGGGELTVDHLLAANTLNLAGTANLRGAYLGGVDVGDGGLLNTSADVTADTVNVTGGEVRLGDGADVIAADVNVSGGTVDASTGRVMATGQMVLGTTTLAVDSGSFAAAGPDLLDLTNTRLEAIAVGTAHATITSPDAAVTLGGVTAGRGVQTLTFANEAPPAATAFSVDGLSANGATVNAEDLAVRGTLTPGGAEAGTMRLEGNVELTETAVYACDLDGTAHDSVVVASGELFLGGTLQVHALGVETSQLGATTRTIIDTDGGTIAGVFDHVPDVHVPSAGAAGHLGLGVFHRGVNYVGANVPGEDPATAVAVDLFVAGGGDSNGDVNVDGQDITSLINHFNKPGDPVDRSWTESDTAGGPTGRGDGRVDGQDITDLISNFTGDGGPADEGTASASYNPATGEFTVAVENVMSWNLVSDGHFNGTGLTDAGSVLSSGPGLVSANANTVGEGRFDGAISRETTLLGPLTAAGTDSDRFVLQYVTSYGAPPQIGAIRVVPEPGMMILLLVGVGCLVPLRRWACRS